MPSTANLIRLIAQNSQAAANPADARTAEVLTVTLDKDNYPDEPLRALELRFSQKLTLTLNFLQLSDCAYGKLISETIVEGDKVCVATAQGGQGYFVIDKIHIFPENFPNEEVG